MTKQDIEIKKKSDVGKNLETNLVSLRAIPLDRNYYDEGYLTDIVRLPLSWIQKLYDLSQELIDNTYDVENKEWNPNIL
jgi:hypothetical protein